MKLTNEQFETLTHRLHSLTPALVDDVLANYRKNQSLVTRYGNNLRPMAEQGVTAFGNILLGALQFDAPNLLDRELNWLDRLLEARHIEGEQVKLFLNVFAHRLETDLDPTEAVPLLELIRAAQTQHP